VFRKKPREIVVVGSKVKDVVRSAGLRSDGELVQAAIAIPNLLEARKGANESAAISSLRTLVTTQALFAAGDAMPAAKPFRPLHDRILVERLEKEERTAGGIIIPDTAKEGHQLFFSGKLKVSGDPMSAGSDKRKQSLYFPETMLEATAVSSLRTLISAQGMFAGDGGTGHAHGHLDFLKQVGDPAVQAGHKLFVGGLSWSTDTFLHGERVIFDWIP
jgi:hypothetical protein